MRNKFLKYYSPVVKRFTEYLWREQPVSERSGFLRYGFTVLLLVITTVIKIYFSSSIGTQTPFLLYFAVVILATGFGGIGPGIIATLASSMLACYYFMPPYETLHINKEQAIQLFVFLGESFFIVSLSAAVTRSVKNLRKSEDSFKSLIENINDAILVVDIAGKPQYVSPSIEKVLGYTVTDFNTLLLRNIVHDDDLPTLQTRYAELLTMPGKAYRFLLRLRQKNGQWAWIESTMTNLLGYPAVNGVVSNFRNVNEKVILEKQKDDFIGIATHELKTPVTSIKAYAQILLRKFTKDGNTTAAGLVEKMDGQLNKLIALIGDLLDVTKIEGGRLQLHEGFFEFNTLITELVEELQRTTENHKIINAPANNAMVYGDKDRIGQVFTNLISNAIKYSPDCKDITVTTSLNDGIIQVCVEDCGVGISKENQSRVFERFFRVSGPDNQSFPGLGLGLYISHEIIKRQGGRLWVQSEEGMGSTFCFSLPLDYKNNTKDLPNTL